MCIIYINVYVVSYPIGVLMRMKRGIQLPTARITTVLHIATKKISMNNQLFLLGAHSKNTRFVMFDLIMDFFTVVYFGATL